MRTAIAIHELINAAFRQYGGKGETKAIVLRSEKKKQQHSSKSGGRRKAN